MENAQFKNCHSPENNVRRVEILFYAYLLTYLLLTRISMGLNLAHVSNDQRY